MIIKENHSKSRNKNNHIYLNNCKNTKNKKNNKLITLLQIKILLFKQTKH